MHRNTKAEDLKDRGYPKTPVRRQNKTISANVSPGNINGRRSHTVSPGSSSPILSNRKPITSTSEQTNSPGLLTRGQRSLTSTPENSSTQRELKKLEDYWTRHNPVKEDSPRLRSTRKVIFNIKDCFRERSPKTLKHDVKLQQPVIGNEHKSLPESPIPGLLLTTPNTDDSHTSVQSNISTLNKKICSDNKKVLKDVHETFQIEKETKSVSKTVTYDNKFKTDGNKKDCQKDVEPNDVGVAKHDVADTDSSDSDDDDYIPPRKKLRSEVSQDELWEGIPLTISFKRLAPIPKTSAAKTGEDSVQTLTASENKPEGETKSNKAEKDDDKILIPLTKPVKDRVSTHTDISSTEQAFETGIKRKRSMRLKEKLAGTPSKSKTSYVPPEEHSPVVSITRINCSFEPVNKSPKTQFEDGTDCGSNSELNETILYANKDEAENCDSKKAKDCPGENLLTLTLSQILSADNKYDIFQEEMSEEKIDQGKKGKDNEAIEVNNKLSTAVLTDVAPSISKTINDIFKEISEPCCLLKGQSNEKDVARVESTSENPSRLTRRSKRLSGIENEKLDNDTPEDEYSKYRKSHEIISDVDTIEDEIPPTKLAEESVTSETNIKIASSKHKLFTKKQKKCAKTVPPLRIKLKQTTNSKLKGQGVSKTNQKNANKEKVRRSDKREQKIVSLDREQSSSKIRPSQSSEKEVATPKNTKKKTTKQRKWSPVATSTITLRLNSERRLSAAGSLLSNPMLNKHACVLWSSENRRHMQLSNPHATLSELDAKLSRKWDNLSEKEKLKYFQRARDAIKDENRHSNRRVQDTSNSESDPTRKYTEECSVENFQKLTPALQMSEIKKWLNFYNEVSPESCSTVISTFKEALVEENKNKAEKEKLQEKSKNKSKKNKQKKKEERVTNIDSNANYRKLLFEKIQDQKENVKDVLNLKKKEQSKSVLESYSSLVKRLVCGDVCHFVGDVRSDRLTETLFALRALEKDNKLAVTGNVARGDKEYEDILERLYSWNSPDSKSLVCSLENTEVDAVEIDKKCKKIINFPSLSPKSVANNLPDINAPQKSEVNLFTPLCIGRFNKTSPVNVLTEMVVDDIMKQQPQIGFRNAISLLSNKIVPSPTILPPLGSNIDKSAGNRNQNCNVVFTKLQNPRSSAVTKVNLLN